MITSVRLERFKNFHDATLNLGPLSIIVGTNAAGKSNIRDAFRFIHGMARGYSFADIIGDKYLAGDLVWRGIRGGFHETAEFGFHDFELTTKIEFPNDVEKTACPGAGLWYGIHNINVSFSDLQIGARVRSESFRDSVSYDYYSHHWDDPPEQEGPQFLFVRCPRDDVNRKHGKRIQFLSSQSVLSQFPLSDKPLLRYRKPVQCYLDETKSMQFLDLSPMAMRVPSFPGQTTLSDRGENLSSVLQAICQNESSKIAIMEWIRELTPIDVVDFEFVSDQTGRVLVNLVDKQGFKTSAYSASDGTLRFLGMIAALLGPNAAGFYFLEEIDNGIHPTRLYLLLQLLEQFTKTGKIQVVATTHSPQLLGMLSSESREHASLIYREENKSIAQIKRIVEIPTIQDILEKKNLGRLHETGWLENVMAMTQPEESAE